MEEIKKFLQIPDDYSKACELYNKYGKNLNIKKLIASRKNQSLLPTLIFELKVLLEKSGGKTITEDVKVVVHNPIKTPQEPITLQKKAEGLEEISRQQQHFYNQGAKLSNALALLAETQPHSQEAKTLVSEILDCKNQYNELAEVKKAFQKTGKMPIKVEKPTQEVVYKSLSKDELLKKQKLLRSQVSKAKSNVTANRNNEEKLRKYTNKLQSLEKELLIIEDLLCN
jgi:vacuolar-type H+-ATPase subunit I/STV1